MATEPVHTPLVSVIIPMYNAEDTIERAIQSCLQQSLSDLEVVVVDDASTDRSPALVSAIDDARVRLTRRSANGGPADARNDGLKVARGKWLTFLDADDWFKPNRLERLLEVASIQRSNTVLMDVMDGDKTSLPHKVGIFSIDNMPRFGLSPFASREHIRDANAHFPPGVRYGEDTAFLFLLMSLPGSRLIRIPDRLYHYSRTSGSLTTHATRFHDLDRACDYLLSSGRMPQMVAERLEKTRRRLGIEHAYAMAQDALTRGRIVEFGAWVLRSPSLVGLALGRAPKSALIRVRRGLASVVTNTSSRARNR